MATKQITIKSGDTLGQLAQTHGTTISELQNLNPSIKDPNLIFAGAGLNIPDAVATANETNQQNQEAADVIATQNESSASGITSSSKTVRTEEGKTKKDLSNLQPTSADEGRLREASDNYIAEIDAQIAALTQSSAVNVDGINNQFDEARGNTLKAQEKETGATTTSIARLGGYLGASASANGVMLNLAQTHRAEIGSLEAKRAAAINAANDLMNKRRFDLVRLKLEEAKSIEGEILQRKDKFFEQSMDLQRENRQQDEFERDKIKDELETLGTIASSDDELTLDPERVKAIDDFYGVEGFTNQYLDVVRAGAVAASEKAQLENNKKLVDLLKDIPQGQTVQFPDGTSYTGMGSAGDITTSLQVDDNGNGRIISYNKLTGATGITGVGQVGKSSGGGNGPVSTVEKDEVFATVQAGLEETKDENGNYDPDTYLDYRDYLKEAIAEGEVHSSMLDTIDDLFLNPSYEFFSDDAIIRLRKAGIFAGSEPLAGDGVEDPVEPVE